MDQDCLSLTQIGQKTLSLAKIQQYYYAKRLDLQGTLLPKPIFRQRPKHTQWGQKETVENIPERTSYKQEQTWTLYSPF